jgi:hypothetical protein
VPISNGQWREELAWAAGLFDGEGSIGTYYHTHGRGHVRVVISMSQKRPHVLVRFWQAIGQIGRLPSHLNRSNGHQIFVLQVQGFEAAQAIIAKLWFKLSLPKKEQARTALARYVKCIREGTYASK